MSDTLIAVKSNIFLGLYMVPEYRIEEADIWTCIVCNNYALRQGETCESNLTIPDII